MRIRQPSLTNYQQNKPHCE